MVEAIGEVTQVSVNEQMYTRDKGSRSTSSLHEKLFAPYGEQKRRERERERVREREREREGTNYTTVDIQPQSLLKLKSRGSSRVMWRAPVPSLAI